MYLTPWSLTLPSAPFIYVYKLFFFFYLKHSVYSHRSKWTLYELCLTVWKVSFVLYCILLHLIYQILLMMADALMCICQISLAEKEFDSNTVNFRDFFPQRAVQRVMRLVCGIIPLPGASIVCCSFSVTPNLVFTVH